MLETVLTSAITAMITALAAFLVQERKLRKEFALDVDKVRTEFMAEQVASELLESKNWKKRSFGAIKSRLGGFSDDELRMILVKSGAVCFTGQDGEELWGILHRNKGDL